MVPTLYAIAGTWGLVCVLIASFRPRVVLIGVTSTFLGVATAELARFHIAWQVVATGVWLALGALSRPIGSIGLAATLIGWVGLEIAHRRGESARDVVGAAVSSAGVVLPAEPANRSRWRTLLRPPFDHAEITRNLTYGPEHRNHADLYLPTSPVTATSPAGAPMVLQIHGGGWISGSKGQQGQPLLSHFTSRGWIGVAINYRMGPRHRLPAAIHDVKRAIAWMRTNAATWGGDPDRILVTGGSAGGHLAALAALTIGDPSLQPGFEDADCTVAAAAPMYGVYDLTDSGRHRGHRPMTPFLQRMVMGTRLTEDADGWGALSPIVRLRSGAAPMMVVGCRFDALVPIEETRDFVDRLAGHSPDSVYIELPYAHHSFDIVGSPRTTHVIEGLEAWSAAVLAHS